MKEKIKNFFYNQWIISIGSPIILGLASFLFTSIKNDMSFFECIIIIFNYIKEKTIKILDYKVSIGSILVCITWKYFSVYNSICYYFICDRSKI